MHSGCGNRHIAQCRHAQQPMTAYLRQTTVYSRTLTHKCCNIREAFKRAHARTGSKVHARTRTARHWAAGTTWRSGSISYWSSSTTLTRPIAPRTRHVRPAPPCRCVQCRFLPSHGCMLHFACCMSQALTFFESLDTRVTIVAADSVGSAFLSVCPSCVCEYCSHHTTSQCRSGNTPCTPYGAAGCMRPSATQRVAPGGRHMPCNTPGGSVVRNMRPDRCRHSGGSMRSGCSMRSATSRRSTSFTPTARP